MVNWLKHSSDQQTKLILLKNCWYMSKMHVVNIMKWANIYFQIYNSK